MRDIRFRIVWEDLKEKRHKQIVTLENLLLGTWELPSDRLTTIARDQFTGLLDKNGKEIYEGDILRDDVWSKKEVYKVIWTHGVFGIINVKNELDYDCFHEIDIEKRKLEVIGNIHEKPELLK